MTDHVLQVEAAVKRFNPDELASFRKWFADYEAEKWDEELERDVAAGKLDWLVEEARRDLREGRCSDR